MPRARTRTRAAALPLALAAILLPASPAVGKALRKDTGALSPVLASLAQPSVRALPRQRQARVIGVAPSGPGSLLRRGNRVVVRVRFDRGAIASRGAVRAIGARVLNASRRFQLATVAVAPADLDSLASVPTVAAVTPERAPMVFAAGCEGGSIISEGVGQLRVDEAREAFRLRGKGLTVGVLSDSFNVATEAADGGGPVATHAQQDIVSNDLPGPAGTCSDQQAPVRVLGEGPAGESEDEGRAMLQIVHDLAPHASLAFATAFDGELGFAQNIERLAKPVSEGGGGADVIVDDVGYFEEPFFQDGPVAAAVNKVTAEGVTYLSAAGNDNLFDEEGNEIASWEAPAYRDSGTCPAALVAFEAVEELELHASHCMDFDPASGLPDTTFGITVEPGEILTVDLQWAEPWNGVSTDLDAYLFNELGELVGGSVADNVGETRRPVEVAQAVNESSSPETVDLVVNRFAGTGARLKLILMENGGGVSETEYPSSSGGDVVGPTIFGHAGAASAISVAAIRFNTTTAPERYSSRGPVTHYFQPVEGTGPAAPLLSPEELAKPDVTATDCGRTTFFASRAGSIWRFCGTSAAAPHAAAVAALLRQGDANATAQQIRESLVETATSIGTPPFPPTAVGTGLVDAFSAVEKLPEFTAEEDGPSTVVPPLEVPVSPSTPSSPPPPPTPTPNSFFAKHPSKTVRIHGPKVRLVFRFRSNQSGVTFLCKIDKARFRACGAKLAHTFKPGRHVVKVKARNAAGLIDPTPAVFRFRVERVR